MKYDKIINNEKGIEYGIMHGNSKVLYIKVGNGGSIYGYNHKYLEIAVDINNKYGYTIIVSSNPQELNELNNITEDMKFINECLNNKVDCIYAWGHSNGGLVLAYYSYMYEKITRILISNSPLNYNWYKIKEGLNKSKAKITCIYGTKDPSYIYLELLKNINNVEVIEIKNADHNFSTNYKEFRNAPTKYLLKEND